MAQKQTDIDYLINNNVNIRARKYYLNGEIDDEDKRWETIAELKLRAGENQVRQGIPWEKVPLIGYPTNFGWKVAGGRYNVYHYLHVTTLKRLLDLTERPELRHWYDNWRDYIQDWPSVEAYKRDGIRLECHAARSGGACVGE